MTRQKREYSLEAQFRIPLITDARLLSCRMLMNPPQLDRIRSQRQSEDDLLRMPPSMKPATSRPPPPPSMRPATSRPPPPPSLRPPAEKEARAGLPPKGTRPPPPPSMRPATSRPPPPPSLRPPTQPPQRKPDAESSVIVSLAELQKLGAERGEELAAKSSRPPPKDAEPETAAPSESDSVILSLAELQRIERERVEDEKEAKEQEELEALEEQINELELKEARDRMLGTLRARMDAERSRIDEECEQLGREEAQRMLDEETDVLIEEAPESGGQSEESLDIPIDVEIGLPWEESHGVYDVAEDEMAAAREAFPEREVLWVLPVPRDDDEAGRMIIEKFAGHRDIMLNSKRYFVTDEAGVFAGSRKAARVGSAIHVWPAATTDYDYIGEADLLDRTAPVEWPRNFNYVELEGAELAELSKAFPEGRPRWIHPVPSFESRFEEDLRVLTSYPLAKRFSIRGREYMILDVVTTADWQRAVKILPACRIATRNGKYLSVWNESENGKDMFFSEKTFHSDYYGEPGETMDSLESYIKPYDSEDIQVWLVYDGKEKWLMPIPDNLGEMDSNSLHFMIQVCNQRVNPEEPASGAGETPDGVSPLMSLAGRWYAALPLAAPGTRRTAYDDELRMVHVLPDVTGASESIRKMKRNIMQKVEDSKRLEIILPSDPEERVRYLRLFPQDQLRYLFSVDPSAKDYKPVRPHIELNRRDGSSFRCIVLDEPYPGAVCVARRGSVILEVEEGSIPPEYKEVLAQVRSAPASIPKSGEGTTEEISLEPGSGDIYVMTPPEKQEWGGNDPSD